MNSLSRARVLYDKNFNEIDSAGFNKRCVGVCRDAAARYLKPMAKNWFIKKFPTDVGQLKNNRVKHTLEKG